MNDTNPNPDAPTTPALPQSDPVSPERGVEGPPAGAVTIDLDSWQKKDKQPPFWFQHDGRWWQLRDPGEHDWQQQWAARRDPRLMIRLLLPAHQRDALLSLEMDVDKLKHLLAEWKTHYKVDDDEAGAQPF